MPATLPALQPRICDQCQNSYRPKKPNQRFCGRACGRIYENARARTDRQNGVVRCAETKKPPGDHKTNWAKAASLASPADLAAVLREMILSNPEKQRVWMILRSVMLHEEERWQRDVALRAELEEMVQRLEQGEE